MSEQDSGAAIARYGAAELLGLAERLLRAAGMAEPIAGDVAQVLLEGDLLGHDTHGLNLLAGYLAELAAGRMRAAGDPEVLAERSSVATWDGRKLPGPHLVRRAIAWAAPRAREHGSATVTIRHSHHIACLAAYLEAPAREGLMVLIASSNPAVASVAPYGGTQAVFTPDPVAIGIPTSGDPILIDVSASITTNGMSTRLARAGARGRHAWWLDADGRATDDPAVIFARPPGTILPLGGLDAGHKGYGLALTIEALTSALSGWGRADAPSGEGAAVWLQVYDPSAFGGTAAFVRETDWVARACHESRPRDPAQPVRLPGERGLARKHAQQRDGVALHPAIMPALAPHAQRAGVALPAALG